MGNIFERSFIMKVAFWSNCKGRAGTTSNMACMSVICTMLKQTKSILFENHFNLNGLEQAFVQQRRTSQYLLREELSYYDQTGLEGLMRRVHSNHTYEEVMEDVSLKFLDNLIYYLPKKCNMNQEYFEFELNQVIKPLMTFLSNIFEFVFVDTAYNNTLSTKSILEGADLVVVNLCQNKILLDHFFSNYESLVEKSYFLIGCYQKEARYNLKNIRRRYQIPKNQIGVIPYNLEFGEAVNSGTIIQYLLRNFSCDRDDENYFFISQVKEAAQMMLDCLSVEEVSVVS